MRVSVFSLWLLTLGFAVASFASIGIWWSNIGITLGLFISPETTIIMGYYGKAIRILIVLFIMFVMFITTQLSNSFYELKDSKDRNSFPVNRFILPLSRFRFLWFVLPVSMLLSYSILNLIFIYIVYPGLSFSNAGYYVPMMFLYKVFEVVALTGVVAIFVLAKSRQLRLDSIDVWEGVTDEP